MNDTSHDAEAQSNGGGELCVVFSAIDEIQATLVVDALKDAGLKAMMQGQHTASFRAENWTDVKVVVQAKEALDAKRVIDKLDLHAEVDWDQIDVGEPDE